MIIPSITPLASTPGASGASEVPNSSVLGAYKSEFMQILLAQLQHQNPFEPMDDTAMIAQMTQLNSLEELQKINVSLQTLIEVAQPPATGETV